MDRMLLRPTEVADLLGIGRSKVYELISGGVIPSLRIGASVRVPVESLRAWITQQGDDSAKTELIGRVDAAQGR